MRVTAIITSACRGSLRRTLTSLARQARRPDSVVVVHSCDRSRARELVEGFGDLGMELVEQRGLGVPGAVNTAINEVDGDLALFIDDDALAPPGWVKLYERAFEALPGEYAALSSRDVYFTASSGEIVYSPDDRPLVRAYRSLGAPIILARPHQRLREYLRGVYIDVSYRAAHGPCIPGGACLSLPLRGANMAFRAEALREVRLPESLAWLRGRGYEQYVGLQLVLRGYRSAYLAANPVLHETHPSTSRAPRDPVEGAFVRSLFKALLEDEGP